MATFNRVSFANASPRGGGDNRLASIPAKAKHVNDLIDSLETGDNTYSGHNTFKGLTSNYLDFATGNASNLQGTVVAVTDAEADAGVGGNAAAILAATLNAGALNTCAHDGGAVGAVYLPICAQDTHTAVHITGDLDQNNALTFFARGAASAGTAVVFNKQTISFNGKGGIGVITSGTPASPTAIKLIYTAASADTNALGAGSVIHFYAPVANRWVVRIDSIAEGTGATGTLTTATS